MNRTEMDMGPWTDALHLLDELDPQWAESCRAMSTNPWNSQVLPARTVELVSLAINAACTNMCAEATRRHIRAALQAGATAQEVLLVIKMASLLSIHSCSLGAPILLEEAAAAGLKPPAATTANTPVSDKMRAAGMWNPAWDPFFTLDPAWTEQFMATGVGVYAGGIIDPKLAELLSIAFDASFTHMYAPGTRRHIKAALAHGATMAEIMEVLKLCTVHGMQAANMAVPILAEELARAGAAA